MKTRLKYDKINNIILDLRGESWHYLAALAAVLLLAIILIYSVIFNGYALIATGITSHQNTTKISQLHEMMTKPLAKPTTATTDYLALFGTAPINAANYILLGIEYSKQNPADAKAIISSDSDDKIYGVGDKLPQGAVINSIEADHVMIMNNGISEMLSLQWELPTSPNSFSVETR